jgi:hypothetical protein
MTWFASRKNCWLAAYRCVAMSAEAENCWEVELSVGDVSAKMKHGKQDTKVKIGRTNACP